MTRLEAGLRFSNAKDNLRRPGSRMFFRISAMTLFFTFAAAYWVCGMKIATGPAQEFIFKEGKGYYDSGQFDRARATWSNIFPDTLYGPVAYLLLARKDMGAGSPDKAEISLKELLNKHPDSVYNPQARQELAEALSRQTKPEAKALLVSMIEKASEKDRPALLSQLGDLEKRLGNYSDATSHYRALSLNYPATVEGLKAADEIAWMVFHGKIPKFEFSEAEQMGRAARLFARGRFDLAADTYSALLKTKPGDKELMLKLAQCRYKDRQNQKAISLLKELLAGALSEKQRTEALHMLSLIYWRLDKEKDFEFCCNKILSSGSAAAKKKALFSLGVYNFEKGRFAAAHNYFAILLAANPEPSVRATVRWKLAWIKYLNREFGPAAVAFRDVRSGPSAGKMEDPSKYWQSRALMHANRSKEAEPLLKDLAQNSPLSYYGFEAARRLKSMNVEPNRDKKSGQSFPEIRLTSAENSNSQISTALKLMEIGLDGFALISSRIKCSLVFNEMAELAKRMR